MPSRSPSFQNSSFSDPIKPGTFFRHKSFDITCEVVQFTGHSVRALSIDSDGKVDNEVVDIDIFDFRKNWRPKLW